VSQARSKVRVSRVRIKWNPVSLCQLVLVDSAQFSCVPILASAPAQSNMIFISLGAQREDGRRLSLQAQMSLVRPVGQMLT